MSGFDFDIFLSVVLFIFVTWGIARLFRAIGLPGILGALAGGVLLGPEAFDMVPYGSDGNCRDNGRRRLLEFAGRYLAGDGGNDCTQHFYWRDDHIESIWVFIGNVGVTLMIMVSGMHIHFEKMREVGPRALVVAILGTILPLVTGLAVVGAFTGRYMPDGFAAGCAFAPTSVGISIRLLDEAKMLNSIAGQTTLTAAFVDDIFSLITLNILYKVAEGSVSAGMIVAQIAISFGFLGAAVIMAIYVFPHLKPLVLDRFKDDERASIQKRDEFHLFVMFGTLCFFGWAASAAIGSHLLGAFAAGMCFTRVPRSQQIFSSQMKRLLAWGVHIFFAATVGFAIPVSQMLTIKSFYQGVILAIGPTISTKLISGFAAYKPWDSTERRSVAQKASVIVRYLRIQPVQMLVGIAMVARGEFAYLVAKEARSLVDKQNSNGEETYMLQADAYAMVIWALVLSTIASPVLFKWALSVYMRASPIHRAEAIGGDAAEAKGKAFVIRIVGHHHTGVLHEILNELHASGMDVLEAKAESDGDTDFDQFVVRSRGKQKDFDDEKLEEIRHALQDLLNDKEAQIIFEPINEDFASGMALEIAIIGEHHPETVHHVSEELARMGLGVGKMLHETSTQLQHGHKTRMDHEVIYAYETNVNDPITDRRRKSISDAINGVLKEEHIHGEVMVKLVHEYEAQVAHMKPHFKSGEHVYMLRSIGKHHNEVLHEITGEIERLHLDIVHAEVDTKGDNEEEIFYFQQTDGAPMSRTARASLRETILAIHERHDLSGDVTVSSCDRRGSALPASPITPQTPSKMPEIPEIEHDTVSLGPAMPPAPSCDSSSPDGERV